jgi:hypothetical protein
VRRLLNKHAAKHNPLHLASGQVRHRMVAEVPDPERIHRRGDSRCLASTPRQQ